MGGYFVLTQQQTPWASCSNWLVIRDGPRKHLDAQVRCRWWPKLSKCYLLAQCSWNVTTDQTSCWFWTWHRTKPLAKQIRLWSRDIIWLQPGVWIHDCCFGTLPLQCFSGLGFCFFVCLFKQPPDQCFCGYWIWKVLLRMVLYWIEAALFAYTIKR